jgi:DNA-binding NtrC family response regulator
MASTNPTRRPILIAETNFVTARLLLASLQAAGHPAVVARSGDEVLKFIDKYRPELLVLNMNLGRPSGLELLRTLHQRDSMIKVLAATGAGQAEMKAAASSLGVKAFFEFPFVPADFARRVAEMLSGPPA